MMKTTKKRTTRRKRTGNSPCWAATLFLCALSIATGAVVAAAQTDSKLHQYALVAGTVFSEEGLALRGARVLLIPDPQSAKGRKTKKLEAVSDSRGEFAFRIPAGAGRYTVRVTRSGFGPLEKPVTVTGDERVDVSIQLTPGKK